MHLYAVLTLTTHSPGSICLVDTLWGATSGKERWFLSALFAVLHLCLSLRVQHHPSCGPPTHHKATGSSKMNWLQSHVAVNTFFVVVVVEFPFIWAFKKCLANATSTFCFCNCVIWKSIEEWDKLRCSGNGMPPGSEDLRLPLFLSFE